MYDENNSLVNTLREAGYLKTSSYLNAFKKIKREDFVLVEHKHDAYFNFPLDIGHGQTISQPATVAIMIELLQPKKGEKILDIGTGSGWQAALLGSIVGKTGKVIGIELVDELVEFAKENIRKYHLPQVSLIKGNGSKGYPKEEPYDKIIAACAAQASIPNILLKQLKNGGRLLIPIGGNKQSIVVVDKVKDNVFKHKEYPGFLFVPLVE